MLLRLERRVHRGQKRVVHSVEHRLLHLHAVHLVAVDHLVLVQPFDGQPGGCAVHAQQQHLVHAAHVALPQLAHHFEVRGQQPPVAPNHRVHQRLLRVVQLVRLGGRARAHNRVPHRAARRAHSLHRLEHLRRRRLGRHLGSHNLARGHRLEVLKLDALQRVHVHLHADVEPGVVVGVADRSQREHVPEGSTALGVVHQTHRTLLPETDGLADLRHGARVRARALQEAAVAAQNLLPGVLGEVQEALRGKHDGAVRQRGVRNDEVLLDALQRGGQVQPRPGPRDGRRAGELRQRLHHAADDVVHRARDVLLVPDVVLHQQGQALLVRVRRRHHALRLGGDIHLHANELGDGAVLELDGDDGEEVPEGRAVLAVVEQPQGDAATLLGRRADLGHVRPVRLLPL
mmetsp:Transcript_19410/g.37467  ORF Transcript_19410/g.37467 Transcript_19410/m.37467 type:complete len:402 (+) Transcript_19410:1409-2614(+)